MQITKTERVTFRLAEYQRKRISMEAQQNGVSMSRIIQSLIDTLPDLRQQKTCAQVSQDGRTGLTK